MDIITQNTIDKGFIYAENSQIIEHNKLFYILEINLSKPIFFEFPEIDFLNQEDFKTENRAWMYLFDFNLGSVFLKECMLQCYTFSNNTILRLNLSYNLFTPEIYILDETEKNLIKIKNPYYKEFKAKLDQLINFLKQEFKKQNIEYTVIADSAESFKPKNMSSEEYQELLKSRVQ